MLERRTGGASAKLKRSTWTSEHRETGPQAVCPLLVVGLVEAAVRHANVPTTHLGAGFALAGEASDFASDSCVLQFISGSACSASAPASKLLKAVLGGEFSTARAR